MPRCIFELLWRTLAGGEEIFAYVVNRAKNGDHYWVFAHVTPTFTNDGQIVGYHSNRRKAESATIKAVEKIYAPLLEEERKHARKEDQLRASGAVLRGFLASQNLPYDEFVFSELENFSTGLGFRSEKCSITASPQLLRGASPPRGRGGSL